MDGDQFMTRTLNEREKMKIMVGMGSIDDYISFVEAGADEIFVGYVPESWRLKHGTRRPLNRREVLYYNVEIASMSDLLILGDMVKVYGIEVTIVFNSLQYEKELYEEILGIMKECMQAGFVRFIVADPGLISYIQKDPLLINGQMKLVVSGEYGEMNQELIGSFGKAGIKRVIFPRQTTIKEMAEMICDQEIMEFEAFALNEKCHFTGAYCNSLHCDELCHMCRVPYRLWKEGQEIPFPDEGEWEEKWEEEFEQVPGQSGCGLCALWDYRLAGITHLKLVSRGKAGQETVEDIHILKEALQILENSLTKEEYLKKMKKKIFPRGCSGNCYH